MTCEICNTSSYQALGEKNGYPLVRCTGCGFAYLHPMPGTDELNAFYRRYDGTRKNRVNSGRKIARFMRKLWLPVRLAPGTRFLDLGCNTGFAVEAARRLGCESTGIDLSGEAVSCAEEMFPENEYHTATAAEFAGAGRQFDIICCSEVIEHLPSVRPFMEAISRMLSPAGILYLTTPNAGHFRVPRKFVDWTAVTPPEHTCYFNKSVIRRLFGEYGLELLFAYPMIKASLRVVARKRRSGNAKGK